ncbi:Uncharacterised protein [Vibrio cholerae]|uniref:Uncharacterized protein n=1 Tax=Vibrio cholerae TaxID=666 RepID=A0A655ZN06_VIBCL|nr:Uncharacterised protein [Vibrio cholerae]
MIHHAFPYDLFGVNAQRWHACAALKICIAEALLVINSRINRSCRKVVRRRDGMNITG